MTSNRNAPCDCGSGRKFKQCCGLRERGRRSISPVGASLPGKMPAGLIEGADWEVEFVPLVAYIEDSPEGRPTLLLCMVDGYMIQAELLSKPPAEPERLAILMGDAIRSHCRDAGEWPKRVLVRHSVFVEPLTAILAGDGVRVQRQARLPGLDQAIPQYYAHQGNSPDLFPPIQLQTWAAWGFPKAKVAELFRACAAVYRAAPWESFYDRHGLEVRTSRGSRWYLIALGAIRESFAILLFSEKEDWLALRSGQMMQLLRHAMAGSIININFDEAEDLLPTMRREIKRARWELAGPKALPSIFGFNLPGAALDARALDDILDILHALPSFMDEAGQKVLECERRRRVLDWQHPPSGLSIHYDPALVRSEWISVDDDDDYDEVDEDEPLTSCLIEGPASEPMAALDLDYDMGLRRVNEFAFLDRFEAHLEGLGRVEATRNRHLNAAAWFLEFLFSDQGVPLRAISEYDLRNFLFDWYPRKADASLSEAERMPASLLQFFRYLSEHEGLQAPWALRILKEEREDYLGRLEDCPGSFWFSPGVAAWRASGMLELEWLGLIHDGQLVEGQPFGQYEQETGLLAMSPEEARVEHLLTRHWQIWHDEAIAEGLVGVGNLIIALEQRRRAWVDAPHPALDGKTPREVVQAASRKRPAKARRGRPERR